MKEKKIHSGRSFLLKLLLFVSLPVLLITTSCKDGDGHHDGDNLEVKLNCVVLSKAQVQAWVDSGWTQPDSTGQIRKIVLQFYFNGKANDDLKFQLVAYPGVSSDNVKYGGKTVLAVDTTCKSEPLSGETIFSNNVIGIQQLGILNPDGTLKDFDYIRFIPERYPQDTEYLNYKVEVIIKGAPQAIDQATWPCLPHCPNPGP